MTDGLATHTALLCYRCHLVILCCVPCPSIPGVVSQDADLVVVEFSANDSPTTYTSQARHSYEGLLRKLMGRSPDRLDGGGGGGRGSSASTGDGRIEHQPAVVLLHHYPWYKAAGDGLDKGLYYREPEHQLTMYSYVRTGQPGGALTGRAVGKPSRPCAAAVTPLLPAHLPPAPAPTAPLPRCCSIMTCPRCLCALPPGT